MLPLHSGSNHPLIRAEQRRQHTSAQEIATSAPGGESAVSTEPTATTLDLTELLQETGTTVLRSPHGRRPPRAFGQRFQTSSVLVLLVLRGEVNLSVHLHPVTLTGPAALVIRPGTPVSGLQGTDADYGIVAVDPACATEIDTMEGLPIALAGRFDAFRAAAAGHDAPLKLPPRDAVLAEQMLDELDAEARDRAYGHRSATRALITLLFVHLRRLQEERHTPVLTQESVLFSEVLEYIDQHYRRPLEMAEIAHHVNRSPAYLTTLLRMNTGKTLLGWVTDRRLAEARRLLRDTDLPVAQIGQDVGYSSPSYFTRLFGRHVGITPARYRGRVRRS